MTSVQWSLSCHSNTILRSFTIHLTLCGMLVYSKLFQINSWKKRYACQGMDECGRLTLAGWWMLTQLLSLLFLNRMGEENMMEKLLGSDKDREVT